MDFIFFVIVVLILAYFNGRIRALEKKIITPPSPVIAPQPIQQSIQPKVIQPVSPSPVMASKPLDEEAGGQLLGKIGILAVFIGVAFFLKYAFDNNLIGVTGRILLGAVVGIFLIALGQFLRRKYLLYSDILMGGGIGILYLTVFAAFSFYSLISAPVAFGLLIGVMAISVIMSIIDSAITLAAIGVIGGFLTPLLISLNAPNFTSLFTYLLIIDIGVLIVSFKYRWTVLNYIAFAGTFLVSFNWYIKLYEPSQLAATFLYASLYFLVFVLVTIMHNIVRKETTKEGDLALITLNAVSYAGILYLLFNPMHHGSMGFIMLALSVFYFVVALAAFANNREDKYLVVYLSALSVLFLTLAIPLQFNGSWITVLWLVEAVLLFITDYSLRGKNLYTYGSIIFFIGLARFIIVDNHLSGTLSNFVIFNNKRFLLMALAIVCAYIITYISNKEWHLRSDESSKSLMNLFLIVAQLMTIYAVSSEIYYLYNQKTNATVTQYQTENVGSTPITSVRIAEYDQKVTEPIQSLNNQRNTVVSILWALYAILLMAIGFAGKSRTMRIFGLAFFFITALKVFVDVWSLGPIYRIVSSIVFGVLALIGSFAYAKFKDRIRKIV